MVLLVKVAVLFVTGTVLVSGPATLVASRYRLTVRVTLSSAGGTASRPCQRSVSREPANTYVRLRLMRSYSSL